MLQLPQYRDTALDRDDAAEECLPRLPGFLQEPLATQLWQSRAVTALHLKFIIIIVIIYLLTEVGGLQQ